MASSPTMQRLFLLSVACLLRVQASHIVYNNELYARDSPLANLQANLIQQDSEQRTMEPRFSFNSVLNQYGLLNRNSIASLSNRLPVIRNPEFTSLLTRYDSCTAPDGEGGVCLGAGACALIGGRASGSCIVGSVCCISVVSKCSGTITMNNTYWQSPAGGVAPSSTCSVTVRTDQNLPEQKKYPICQLRLDFVSFSISQPLGAPAGSTGKCATDGFQVSGASTKPPVICGDNEGQHMYISFPPSSQQVNDVQLTFSFGSVTASRSWNIKIALIPCGATYAAPPDCLQYFTGGSGAVKSFNWKDTAVALRQLASQDYNICFRSELLNGQRANGICYQTCTVTNAGAAFGVSTAAADKKASVGVKCDKDFLVIGGGVDANGNINDRFCGASFNGKQDEVVNVQVCSAVRSFKIYVKADDNDDGDTNNMGFCLNFMQRVQ